MLDSWFTTFSGQYARIYTNDAAKTAGTAATTWSNGSQNQLSPAYSGIQEIYSSASWVYIRSTGLGSHIMGPWQTGFPNLPANTHTLYRIPRTPTVPGTKTLTGLGSIGYFVDGVSMFDSRDGFVWTGSSESGSGTGYWNRDAYVNESATFDPAYAHQENSGTYHYHANPIALRYLLGDHVDFNSATKTYSESTNAITKHSPILGWARDGFPVYGPYGYSTANDSSSGVRRMISGFQLRNGQKSSDNLSSTGRTTIPAWAVRVYNVSSGQTGPTVNTTYPLGRYMEDNAYLGDLGYNQGADFDLDEYNGRTCVTPEFPGGTYAYFVSISSNGAPVFPYNIGRAFYGNPTGASVTSLTEIVTTNYVGGPNSALQLRAPSVNRANATVTLTWSSVEGGTYRLETSTGLPTWTTNVTGIASQGVTSQLTTNAAAHFQFYRVVNTALATYDSVSSAAGGDSSGGILSISPNTGARGGSVIATITLSQSATPPVPPQNAPINTLTIGAISGTSTTRPAQYTIQSTFNIPANAGTGAQTVTVVFPGPPNNPSQTVTYTLANGFTIQ